MIERPYESIREDVVSVLKPLIDKSKDSYHQVHARRHARTLEVLLDNKISGKILELGTSHVIPAAIKSLIPDATISVTDFDPTKPLTSRMVVGLGKNVHEVDCYTVDLETQALPVEDETFDAVICSEVIEHMDVDPMFMLSEVNRVLKKGGKLILTTPSSCGTRALWKVLRGYEPYFYMQYHIDGNRYRHNYEYSPRTLRKVLECAGFELNLWTEDTFEYQVVEDMERLASIGYKFDMNMMGDNIFVVGKKISDVKDRYPSVLYV